MKIRRHSCKLTLRMCIYLLATAFSKGNGAAASDVSRKTPITLGGSCIMAYNGSNTILFSIFTEKEDSLRSTTTGNTNASSVLACEIMQSRIRERTVQCGPCKDARDTSYPLLTSLCTQIAMWGNK